MQTALSLLEEMDGFCYELRCFLVARTGSLSVKKQWRG